MATYLQRKLAAIQGHLVPEQHLQVWHTGDRWNRHYHPANALAQQQHFHQAPLQANREFGLYLVPSAEVVPQYLADRPQHTLDNRRVFFLQPTE